MAPTPMRVAATRARVRRHTIVWRQRVPAPGTCTARDGVGTTWPADTMVCGRGSLDARNHPADRRATALVMVAVADVFGKCSNNSRGTARNTY